MLKLEKYQWRHPFYLQIPFRKVLSIKILEASEIQGNSMNESEIIHGYLLNFGHGKLINQLF